MQDAINDNIHNTDVFACHNVWYNIKPRETDLP